MHTIILNSDDAANTYLTSMLEMINSDLKFNTVLDTAESLADLGSDVNNLLSTVPSVAFTAFRDQFSSGNTMMFVSDEDSKKLEIWNDRNEEFQIAVFRHDGQPVGLYGKAYLNWLYLLTKSFMKTPKTVELRNSFHNTKIRVRYKSYMVPENQDLTWWYIQFSASDSNDLYGDNKSARGLMNRIKNKLCGINDCTCGTVR